MEEKKCKECTMPLDEETTCSCNKELCVYCCECGEECKDCDCAEKAEECDCGADCSCCHEEK